MEWTHWICHSIIIVSLRFINLSFVHSLILCLSTTILCQSLWKGLRPQQRMIGTINPCPHKAHSLGMGTEKEGKESVVMSGEGEMEGVWMLPDPERVVKKTQSYSATATPRGPSVCFSNISWPYLLFFYLSLTLPQSTLPAFSSSNMPGSLTLRAFALIITLPGTHSLDKLSGLPLIFSRPWHKYHLMKPPWPLYLNCQTPTPYFLSLIFLIGTFHPLPCVCIDLPILLAIHLPLLSVKLYESRDFVCLLLSA